MYEKFKALVQKKKLSVAEVCRLAEIDYYGIDNWRQGRSTPKMKTCAKIAAALDMTLDDFYKEVF